MRSLKAVCSSLIIAYGMTIGGCGKTETPAATTAPATKPTALPLVQVTVTDWCKEHLMPETICVQCHPDLADDFKKKGDWCAEHSVPDTQCFKHHPELKDKFAAAFKAKYGKEPPTDSN